MPRWSFLLLLAGCTFGSGTERPGKVATSANYYGTSTTWDTGGGTATWTTGTVTTYYGYTGTTTTGYYGYTTGYYGYTNYGYSSYYYTDEYYTEPTCECATLTITVTVDGVLAEPDDITIDIGTGRRGFGSVGGTGSNGVYSVDYCTDECVTEVTVGAVTQTLNCEDFLQGYVTGQCGQDAVLEFQFDGTATGTTGAGTPAGTAGGTTTASYTAGTGTGGFNPFDTGGVKNDGCSCAAGPGPLALGWLGVLALVGIRRESVPSR